MIEIDGSHGEGGGQILRTAVALSAVTGNPVNIKKIRQGRSRPGLAPQHAEAILALANICSGRIQGATSGSSEITFEPGEIRGGSYRVDIGTAGSVTLLMQCLLPAMLKAQSPVSLQVQGGTDVQWAPTVDYFKHVFLPALMCFGAKADLDIRQRGYYPKGQGLVHLQIEPCDLHPCHLKPQSSALRGISHSSNLPSHVAQRQADSALEILMQAGFKAKMGTESLSAPSTGSGITLWSGWKGASAIGERGLPAEKVGKRAAEELVLELSSGKAVDVHLADQLIPYIALVGGSYTTSEISRHTMTNIWTAKHFLKREIYIERDTLKIKAD
jgi:RNA 3'-terminal phosphate cyclase (ATP)